MGILTLTCIFAVSAANPIGLQRTVSLTASDMYRLDRAEQLDNEAPMRRLQLSLCNKKAKRHDASLAWQVYHSIELAGNK